MFSNFVLIAHRGFSAQAPENTIAAFDLAIESGYTDIEFDIQLSKDGVPVVFHDFTVDRTTNGKGRVDAHTFDELQALDAGSWFDASFAGQHIPSLKEILLIYRGRANIHIELKSIEPDMPLKVAELLASTGWVDDATALPYLRAFRRPLLIISSFDRMQVARSMERLPHSIVHELLVENVSDESLQWAADHGIRSYNPDGKDITPELVRKAHKLNLHVGAWWWTREEQIAYPNIRASGASSTFIDALPRRHPLIARHPALKHALTQVTQDLLQ